jgi:hypothetical protein
VRIALLAPLFLVALAGCDMLWQLEDVKRPPDALVISEASVDAPPRCPFSDNFDDNVISPMWFVMDPTQTKALVSEKAGQLDVSLRTDLDDAYNGIAFVDPHDLSSMITRVTIYPMNEAGWYELYFQIYLDGMNNVQFQTGAGGLSYAVVTDGVPMRTFLTYDPAKHRHLQFRHDAVAHLINFEASGDSTTFETLATLVVPWSFSAVKVAFFAGTFQTGGVPPGSARFDDFSVCPP